MPHPRWSLPLAAAVLGLGLAAGCSPPAEQASDTPANTTANAPANAPETQSATGTQTANAPVPMPPGMTKVTLHVKGMH